jgi:hypothetical protein
MAHSTIGNQSLPAIHNGPSSPTTEKALTAAGIGLYSEKNDEISHIVTDMDLIKGQRLHNE